MLKKITKANFKREVLEAERPILVAVMMSDCVWCREQEPILEELAAEGVNIAVIRNEEDRELGDRLGVHAVPCIIAFSNGSEYDRLDGYHSKAILAELAANGERV